MRPTCLRCLRPGPFCVCQALAPAHSRTRVVILQHPREARLAICSAWLTRLALANAEIRRGVRFDPETSLSEARRPGTALLYPGEGSAPAAERASSPPPVLFVVDGTWTQAEKMLRENPVLASLPRLSVDAGRPSGYGALRREPGRVHLSTLEAVALALGALERDAARFAPMIEAFHRQVELQLDCARGGRRRPRHRRPLADGAAGTRAPAATADDGDEGGPGGPPSAPRGLGEEPPARRTGNGGD